MREVKAVVAQIELLTGIPTNQTDIFTSWLAQQAQDSSVHYALAHLEDRVLWGEWRGSAWEWNGDTLLRLETLLELRLFGPTAEVYLWRAGKNLRGRYIQDGAGAPYDYFDETYLLWGTNKGDTHDGFIGLREGQQGMRHAPPAVIAQTPSVTMRHYLSDDENGCAQIVASRLMLKQAA